MLCLWGGPWFTFFRAWLPWTFRRHVGRAALGFIGTQTERVHSAVQRRLETKINSRGEGIPVIPHITHRVRGSGDPSAIIGICIGNDMRNYPNIFVWAILCRNGSKIVDNRSGMVPDTSRTLLGHFRDTFVCSKNVHKS